MVVFLTQVTMIDIQIPADFPPGNARMRTRGGASRIRMRQERSLAGTDVSRLARMFC
jgi:hypothetical protein